MQRTLRKEYSENLKQIEDSFVNKLKETRLVLSKALDSNQVESYDFKAFNKSMYEFEITSEAQIFKIISLQAPISKDLRFLLSTLKSTADLRRIGKTIQRISKVSKKYFVSKEITVDPEIMNSFNEMGSRLLNMFDQILEIYSSSSSSSKFSLDKANEFQKQFSQEDDNVDSLFKETLAKLVSNIQKEIDSKKISQVVCSSRIEFLYINFIFIC